MAIAETAAAAAKSSNRLNSMWRHGRVNLLMPSPMEEDDSHGRITRDPPALLAGDL